MRVLIAGAGYVGGALARRLRSAGHEVRALRRRPQPEGGETGVEALDLGDPSAIAHWLERERAFDVVALTLAASAGEEAAYRAAYLAAPAHLLGALEASQDTAPLVLFTSSTSVYAQDAGEWVDESSPTAPAGFRGRIQLEAEAQVEDAAGPGICVRLGGLYGPGRTRLLDSVRAGRSEATPQFTNRIHRDDAAGALAHLIECAARGARLPALLVGVDDAPAPRSEVIAWLAERLEVPPPPPTPGRPGGKRCRNERLRSTGYRFRYPSYREGYGALLADPEDPTTRLES